MPITIVLPRSEAEVAREAGLQGLEGTRFTYSPRDTIAICEKVAATGAEGAARLVTRLADIYGKLKVKAPSPAPVPKLKRRAKARVNAPSPAPVPEPTPEHVGDRLDADLPVETEN